MFDFKQLFFFTIYMTQNQNQLFQIYKKQLKFNKNT